MTQEALEALKESVEAWKKKLVLAQEWRGEEIRWGCRGCPLCFTFHTANMTLDGTNCIGCPVFRRSGVTQCHYTPYDAVVSASDNYDRDETFENAWDLMEKVEAELNFLISLLPKEVGNV